MNSDTVSSSHRSWIMRQVRSRNTTPELYVRRTLHAAGFRFRIHYKKLPGKPDLVLAKYRTAIFVHGCFWHWHGCHRSRMPSSNVEYWQRKIARNVERDSKNIAALSCMGWRVQIIWECELATSTADLIACLPNFSRASKAYPPSEPMG